MRPRMGMANFMTRSSTPASFKSADAARGEREVDGAAADQRT